jgi:uncharacterized protein (DUF305 family)
MGNGFSYSIPATFLTVLALSGCAGKQEGRVEPSAAPATADDGSSPSAASRDRAARRRPSHTEADVRFMTDMIHHHAQALEMGALAPTHGASESVRILAERIVAGQQDEIATMQRWLRERGRSVPEVGTETGTGHARHGAHRQAAGHAGHDMMPGMLTPEQMAELEQARGAEFDRLFLTYMIQHHRGAVTMVEELFATPGAAQEESVFKFASDAHVDQSTEIARMQRMLGTLGQAEGAP